jgi:ABC-type amino acid transport substrate-binding protein
MSENRKENSTFLPVLSRRSLLHGIAAATAATPFANAWASTTWQEAKSRGSLVVVMSSGYPPFSFIGEDGEQTGFDTDLINEFANRNGLKTDIQITQFEGVLPALIGKKSDIIVSIWATDERRKQVDFSDVYWTSGMTFAWQEGKPTIDSMADAAGKNIGVQQGSWAADVLAKGQPAANQVAYKGGPADMYQDLRIGRLDGVFEDRDVSKYYLMKTAKVFKYSTENFEPGHYAWAIRKGDQALLQAANKFIAEAKADGTLTKLARKYGLTT